MLDKRMSGKEGTICSSDKNDIGHGGGERGCLHTFLLPGGAEPLEPVSGPRRGVEAMEISSSPPVAPRGVGICNWLSGR